MYARLFRMALVALALVLHSCDSPRKQIVGKWRVEGGPAVAVWEFQPNGAVITGSGAPGRYSFGDGKRLKIETRAATFVYQTEIRGDRMIWRDPTGGVTDLRRAE